MNRRDALRATAALGAAGAGLAAATGGAHLNAAGVAAQPAGWRHLRVEFDIGGVEPAVSILRAGMGMPQRGDQLHGSGQIYAIDQPDGPQIGYWQCNAVWAGVRAEPNAPVWAFCTFWYELYDRGAMVVNTNRAGPEPLAHVGAVGGGTGEFTGALGTLRIAPGSRMGLTRHIADLILPDLG